MALITCEECGKEYSDKAEKCPGCGCPNKNFEPADIIVDKPKGAFAAGRLAIGIISILLFVFITFQSCVVGLNNAIQENGSESGSMGFFLGFFMLIAGIVGMCTRNSKGKAGAIITTILYWFAALYSAGQSETYPDIAVWGAISFIFGIVFLIAAIRTKKKKH